MKYINEPPTDFEHLNNLKLREAFGVGSYEPSHFVDCDEVKEGDLTFYIIDQYDEDGLMVVESFLYDNQTEYYEDLNILGL